MDSILNSIKKLLGITAEDESFDIDIIMHINSVFLTLNQLGIGPTQVFSILDDVPTWLDFFGENESNEMVKTYMYLKVRLLFDPPSSSSVLAAIERSISELEFRLIVAAETPKKLEEEDA